MRISDWSSDVCSSDLDRIADLDREIRERMAAIPASRRKIITSHDAFGYFGAAYGIAFIAPVGISPADSPSAGEVAALIRQIRDYWQCVVSGKRYSVRLYSCVLRIFK